MRLFARAGLLMAYLLTGVVVCAAWGMPTAAIAQDDDSSYEDSSGDEGGSDEGGSDEGGGDEGGSEESYDEGGGSDD